MISLFGFLIFVLIGHFGSALFIYLVDRFVFHGNIRRYPIFKHLARLHGLHHAEVKKHKITNGKLNGNVEKYIFVPLWVKISLFLLIVSLGYFVGLGLAVGIASFGVLYSWRHYAIHHHDFTSKFFHHHDYHHRANTQKNFSGMWPFFDKIFGTYVETYPKKIFNLAPDGNWAATDPELLIKSTPNVHWETADQIFDLGPEMKKAIQEEFNNK